jgi:MFS superfamily sulfate permease-like transporter
MNFINDWKRNLKNDLPAGVVVFLVALPLCLGIALASKAPLMSGIIAGVVGGIVVGFLSGSKLSVSGPAAGLTTIVITSLTELGTYEIFLVAVLISGAMQLLLGFLKAGDVGNYVPSPVIKGMLAAIGIILILKQIPHALGYDADYEGDESYEQPDGENTFTTIWSALQTFRPAAGIITALTVLIMVVWELKPLKKRVFFQVVPGALIAVLLGVGLNVLLFPTLGDGFALRGNHLASIPISKGLGDFWSQITFPDFSGINNFAVWKIALTIAIVASLESILSIEAVDKIDPDKKITSKNRELKAQGVGNMVSGLLGGLPITAVIVRSSANLNAGGKTNLSTILHGFLLLFSVVFAAAWLNKIPLAALAGVLFFVGFKLTAPKVFKGIIKQGYMQFIPFLVTIIAILFTDLLVGILIGIGVGMVFTVRTNMQRAIVFTQQGNNYLIKLKRDVYFLNIKNAKDALAQIPNNCSVLIEAGSAGFIDPDIIELFEGFASTAKARGIEIEITGQLAYINT